MKRTNRKKKVSLKRMVLVLVSLCWVIPLGVTMLFAFSSYRNGIVRKTESFLQSELDNFIDITAYRINDAVNLSKSVTYDKTLEKLWREAEKEALGQADFYKKAMIFLNGKFALDERFDLVVYFNSQDMDYLYSVGRRKSEFLTEYQKKVHPEIRSMAEKDTNAIQILIEEEQIYLVRNVYTTNNYKKYGTIVLKLNTERLFKGFHMGVEQGMLLFFNGNTDPLVYGDLQFHKKGDDSMQQLMRQIKEVYAGGLKEEIVVCEEPRYQGFVSEKNQDDYQIGAAVIMDKEKAYQEIRTLAISCLMILVVLIPVLVLALRFLYQNVTMPVERMIDGSIRLEQGELGVQLLNQAIPNQEFDYLIATFNKMSSRLKHLFEYAYTEKLAKKDAKILALQSQINPHFLNNTLEMMNWQARLVGDEQVAKMIEALSTLLNHSMNREHKRLIPLREEVKCADAYFYIVSMRFGKRLTIEREIDERLLDIQVPQLVLQPLLENAIKHGVETVKTGVITVRIREKGECIYLSIVNTGNSLTKEGRERVRNILDGKITDQGSGQRLSLGIRNVNERIKLINGEEYGLDIFNNEEGNTEARITISRVPKEEKEDTFRLDVEEMENR